MGEIINKQRLQAILGKDHKTLLKWQKEGMPVEKVGERGESNSYDTAKVVDWLVKRASDTAGEMEKARLRLLLAQARNAELDAEEKEGALISLDQMKGMLSNVIASCRARLLAFPSSLTPRLATMRDPKKIEKLLRDTVYEILKELAENDPEPNKKTKASGKGGNKNMGTAAAVKPK